MIQNVPKDLEGTKNAKKFMEKLTMDKILGVTTLICGPGYSVIVTGACIASIYGNVEIMLGRVEEGRSKIVLSILAVIIGGVVHKYIGVI